MNRVVAKLQRSRRNLYVDGPEAQRIIVLASLVVLFGSMGLVVFTILTSTGSLLSTLFIGVACSLFVCGVLLAANVAWALISIRRGYTPTDEELR